VEDFEDRESLRVFGEGVQRRVDLVWSDEGEEEECAEEDDGPEAAGEGVVGY
jgi:hypothetical protein